MYGKTTSTLRGPGLFGVNATSSHLSFASASPQFRYHFWSRPPVPPARLCVAAVVCERQNARHSRDNDNDNDDNDVYSNNDHSTT